MISESLDVGWGRKGGNKGEIWAYISALQSAVLYCIVLQWSKKYLSVLFGLSWRGNYRPLPPRMKMLFCWYPKGYKSLVAIYHSFYRDSRLEVKIVSSSIYARLKRRGFGREMIVFCFSVTWAATIQTKETMIDLYFTSVQF